MENKRKDETSMLSSFLSMHTSHQPPNLSSLSLLHPFASPSLTKQEEGKQRSLLFPP